MNLGFKVGALYDQANYGAPAYDPPSNVLDVGYDGIAVSNAPLTVPPGPGFNPPPPGGSGGGGTGGGGGGGGGGGLPSNRNNDNGDSSINDSCHCSVPLSGRWTVVGPAILVALAVAFLRRR